jgi:hypothetical protein
MAGIGKYKKGAAFTLKSGNKPTFQQMSSGSPLDKTLIGNQKNLPEHLRSKIEDAPGKMYDTPGKMYNAPLKADNDETPKVEDKKETAKPKDKLGVKIAKIAANAAIGGFDAVTGHTTKRPTVNFGPDKAEEEAETLTIGQKMLKDDYKLGDLAKQDKAPKYSLGDYKEPSTKIKGSLR